MESSDGSGRVLIFAIIGLAIEGLRLLIKRYYSKHEKSDAPPINGNGTATIAALVNENIKVNRALTSAKAMAFRYHDRVVELEKLYETLKIDYQKCLEKEENKNNGISE